MDPLLKLQTFVTNRLDYAEFFQFIPVKSFRAHVISQEVGKRLPHLAGKNNKLGCGTLVGMPIIEGIDPNVSTPQGEILLPIDTIELPELNMDAASGSLQSAEAVALAVRSHLHAFRIENLITLFQDKMVVGPIEGIERDNPGCIGYRTMLRGRLNVDSSLRLSCPVITEANQTVTLTPSFVGAQIVYTINESDPIPSNDKAILYNAPFTVPSGTTVYWAAYSPGWQGSDYGWARVN